MTDKTHQPCTFPDCDSSDAMTIYDDGHTWCFSCSRGTWPDRDTKQNVNVERARGITFRGIPSDVSEWCGVGTFVSLETGKVVAREYPYVNGSVKVRTVPKSFYVTGENTKELKNQLFLIDKDFNPSKSCTIVEGEEDAMAHLQMMGKYPVYSPSSATNLLSALKENYEHLMKFEEIIFVMDADDAGQAAFEKARDIFPYEKVKVVKLSKELKDPNGYLITGHAKEYKALWWDRVGWSPDSIIIDNKEFDVIFDDGKSYSFEPTGIPDLDAVIYGLTTSCLTLIKGDEGLGKTELLGLFEYNMLKNSDHKIGVVHLEETPLRQLQRMVSYECGEAVHLPENTVPIETQKEKFRELNKEHRYHLMDVRDMSSINGLIEHIRYLAQVMGCKFIFIDPINHVGDMGDDTVTKNLDYLAKKLGKMAADLDIGIIVTAHINDDGRVRDSKMFEKVCYIRLEIDRDNQNEDDEIRNTTNIRVTKNRPWATTGNAGHVLFDRKSFTLTPHRPYVATSEGPPL